jgi:hypothetical protein
MSSTVKHLRSSTADKRPTASGLADGQLGINTASGTPGIFFKDSAGTVVKVGPAHVGSTAPNVTPAGSAGNSMGELWVNNGTTIPGLNYYTGSAFVNLTPSGTLTTAGLVELATAAETQAGTDSVRAVTPSGLQSKISDSTSTASSTTIASSAAVKQAYDLAAAAVATSGTSIITGELLISNTGSLVFEGSVDDSFETTLAVVNPTADRTITLPNITGTVITTGDTNTVTGTMIASGTITNTEISASAAIALSKLATGALPSGITVSSGNIVDGTITNADVNASAAIAGTKVAPNFGSQNVVTTGTATAASLTPTGSGVPTNGVYLPAANSVAVSTNGTQRLTVDTAATTSTLPVVHPLGAVGTPSITFTGDLNTGFWSPAADTIAASTNGSERVRIDSSGRLLVGTSTARTNFFNGSISGLFQVEGANNETNRYTSQIYGLAASVAGPVHILAKHRSSSIGGVTVVEAEDQLGALSFQGSDGTEFVEAARIQAFADGTPGANDMPGRLVFSTTTDGASSPTERMMITNGGIHRMYSGGSVLDLVSNVAAGTTFNLILGRHSGTGLDTGTASFAVRTNGNVVNTNNSYGAISDIKLKENIVDANSQWDDLKALQVRKYNLKEGQTHTQIGLVAQEVELVSPGLVSESPDRDAEGNDLGTVTKSVSYSVLYMKAVKALQEAMERIETLEAKVAALEAQ